MPILLLIADALVFVLPFVARLDLVLPAHAIALGPLPATVAQRLVVPGTAVGLALILALLVDHDLLFLPARGETEGHRYDDDKRPHEGLPAGGCGCCCGAPCPGVAPRLPGP